MNLSTLLLGNFSNLSQDAQIEAVKKSARIDIASNANFQRNDLKQLASLVELRIKEVERDNAILGMLVMRLLKHLGETQPKETKAIIHDIREVLNSSAPTPNGLDCLRQSLDLPPAVKTTVHAHGKPPKGPAPRKLRQHPPAPGVTKPVFKSPAAPKSSNPPQLPVIAKKTPEDSLPSAFPK